jgi:hypothetical protein
MIKLLLYLLVLTAFIPLTSSGKIKPPAKKHVSEIRNITASPSFDEDAVLFDNMERMLPFQDSLGTGKRKKIKEVGRSQPQAKPEKVERRDPDDRPKGADPGNIQRPPADRPNARPGGRPPGGAGTGRGARPQGPPPRGR